MAWEGEKTLTFTVEDALITLETFWALTGAEQSHANNTQKFTVKPTSFAGFYGISAETLFRDENGVDHEAKISIPKAKLQTTLNLSMAPTGDPSSFTLTFDAFPETIGDDEPVLFTLEVGAIDEANKLNETNAADQIVTTVIIGDEVKTIVNAKQPVIGATAQGALTLKDEAIGSSVEAISLTSTLSEGKALVSPSEMLAFGQAKTLTLVKGEINRLYIVSASN